MANKVQKKKVIDVLLVRNILGESSDVQVTNREGFLGKFNSILMNKILVMVGEVAIQILNDQLSKERT